MGRKKKIDRCLYQLDDGSLCNKSVYVAGDSFCTEHKQYIKKARSIKSMAENIVGIPDINLDTYNAFYKSIDPTNLTAESAVLRTLSKELTNLVFSNINYAKRETQVKMQETLQKQLRDLFCQIYQEDSWEKFDPVIQRIIDLFFGVIHEHVPMGKVLKQDVHTLSQVLDTITKIGERQKRILDGRILTVEFKTDHISRFINTCVLPYVNSTEQREQIVKACREFEQVLDEDFTDDGIIEQTDNYLPTLGEFNEGYK